MLSPVLQWWISGLGEADAADVRSEAPPTDRDRLSQNAQPNDYSINSKEHVKNYI